MVKYLYYFYLFAFHAEQLLLCLWSCEQSLKCLLTCFRDSLTLFFSFSLSLSIYLLPLLRYLSNILYSFHSSPPFTVVASLSFIKSSQAGQSLLASMKRFLPHIPSLPPSSLHFITVSLDGHTVVARRFISKYLRPEPHRSLSRATYRLL